MISPAKIVLAALALSAPLAHAADAIGWVDSARLREASTEVARVNAHIAAAKTQEQAQTVSIQGNKEIQAHLRDACAKVKTEKHLSMVVSDPLAADPKAEVTADVLRMWNAADEAGVAQENARLTARVAQLEADAKEKAAMTKPGPPSVPPPPPTQPLASKGKK